MKLARDELRKIIAYSTADKIEKLDRLKKGEILRLLGSRTYARSCCSNHAGRQRAASQRATERVDFGYDVRHNDLKIEAFRASQQPMQSQGQPVGCPPSASRWP